MIACPSCSRTFDLDVSILPANVHLFCEKCRHVFLVDNVLASSRVLVAVDNAQAVAVLRSVIEPLGLSVLAVEDGEQLLAAAKVAPPRLVLCDVAVSKVYAFAAVAALKKMNPAPHVVLLASVYDRTAYKRTPHSLHGADDYLELHHIPDRLPGILAAVFQQAAPAVSADRVDAQRKTLREASQEDTTQRLVGARSLAWRLVLDIALYQQARFVEALNHKTPRDLLREELTEAASFLAARMDASERHLAVSLIDEALGRLVAQRTEGRS